jgi:hypothetical protein
VVGEAHAVAAPAARAVVGPLEGYALSAARAMAGPAQAVATPAARALAPAAHAVAAPAARVLAERMPPPPPRVEAARSASARMARGSGGLVIPERLAERLGLPSGHHAAATPGIGPIVGLRDLAVGFLVITSLDDPLRLRAATALAAAVDAFDSVALAAPFAARRVVGGAALRGGTLALHAADLWTRFLSSGQPGAGGGRRVRQLPPPRAPRVVLPRQ